MNSPETLDQQYAINKTMDETECKTNVEERPGSKLSFSRINDIVNDLIEIAKSTGEHKPTISEMRNYAPVIAAKNDEGNLENVTDVCSSLTEDFVSLNKATAELKEDCLESNCDIVGRKKREYSEIQKTEENSSSGIMDLTECEKPLLYDPGRQFNQETGEEATKVNEYIESEDLNISAFGTTSSNDRFNPEKLIDICFALTESLVSHLELPADLKEEHSENKSCGITNFNLGEYSGILNQESDGNSITINQRAEQTECKISGQNLPRSKLLLKKKILGFIRKVKKLKHLTNDIENHESESLKRINEEKADISDYEKCFPRSNAGTIDKASEGENLSNLNKRSIETNERNSQRRIPRLYEINPNRAEARDDLFRIPQLDYNSLIPLWCFAIVVALASTVMIKYSEKEVQKYLRERSNCSPNMPMDQLMSFLLVDVFEDRKWANEGRMYSIASMYGMQDLKNRTSSSLRSSITVSNAWITLVLADVYEDQKLKESAELFLTTYSNETLYSENWKAKMLSMMITASHKYIEDFKPHYLGEE
ncbi:unnamed protein product [Larinioides sclopetarius]|uniref:Uncharacterized protein n=1 Tax=Larinioides sclopetarius TaxID=280406 RepID=A0AAV2BEH3_9ARAC